MSEGFNEAVAAIANAGIWGYCAGIGFALLVLFLSKGRR